MKMKLAWLLHYIYVPAGRQPPSKKGGEKMSKNGRTSKRWLEEYFGLDLSGFKGRKGRFVQMDGGRGTWDFDTPSREDGDWERVFQSNSKTYYFIPKLGGRLEDE